MNPYLSIMVIACIGLIEWRKLNYFLNPVTAFCLGHLLTLLGLVLSIFLPGFDSYLEIDIQDVSQIYVIAIFSFWLPWLIKRNTNKIQLISKSLNEHPCVVSVAKVSAVILLINIIVALTFLGRVPFIEMLFGNLVITDHLGSLKNLPFGLMAIQTGIAMVLALYITTFFRRKSEINIRSGTWLLLFTAYTLAAFWQGNRQLILFILFVLVARFFDGSAISRKFMLRRLRNIFIGIALFISCFIMIQNIRLQGQGASSLEILGYLTFPALNISKIMEILPGGAESFWPNFIFTELIPHRLRNQDYENIIMPILFEPSSPSGYISYWYMDWGTFGVVIGALLLSQISKIIFLRRTKSEHNMRLYILILWCCATSSIYSHFISLNNFIFPVIILILAKFLGILLYPRERITKRFN